jgi:hypothetical protein
MISDEKDIQEDVTPEEVPDVQPDEAPEFDDGRLKKGDDGYDRLYEAWLHNGKPPKLNLRNGSYLVIQNNGVFFLPTLAPNLANSYSSLSK